MTILYYHFLHISSLEIFLLVWVIVPVHGGQFNIAALFHLCKTNP